MTRCEEQHVCSARCLGSCEPFGGGCGKGWGHEGVPGRSWVQPAAGLRHAAQHRPLTLQAELLQRNSGPSCVLPCPPPGCRCLCTTPSSTGARAATRPRSGGWGSLPPLPRQRLRRAGASQLPPMPLTSRTRSTVSCDFCGICFPFVIDKDLTARSMTSWEPSRAEWGLVCTTAASAVAGPAAQRAGAGGRGALCCAAPEAQLSRLRPPRRAQQSGRRRAALCACLTGGACPWTGRAAGYARSLQAWAMWGRRDPGGHCGRGAEAHTPASQGAGQRPPRGPPAPPHPFIE